MVLYTSKIQIIVRLGSQLMLVQCRMSFVRILLCALLLGTLQSCGGCYSATGYCGSKPPANFQVCYRMFSEAYAVYPKVKYNRIPHTQHEYRRGNIEYFEQTIMTSAKGSGWTTHSHPMKKDVPYEFGRTYTYKCEFDKNGLRAFNLEGPH